MIETTTKSKGALATAKWRERKAQRKFRHVQVAVHDDDREKVRQYAARLNAARFRGMKASEGQSSLVSSVRTR